jgi:hypothetical protein
MITAAGRMLWKFGRGAIRQTKHLSPFTTKSVTKDVVKKGKKSIGTGIATHVGKSGKRRFTQELRPWAKSIVGKKGLIAKTANVFGVKNTSKIRGIATDRYASGYRHVRKHKKLYGSGVAGAAIWDIMDNDNT